MTNLINRIAYVTIIAKTRIVKISDLKVEFIIEKTEESTPNTSKISIYNMNPDHRGLAEENELMIQLEVGYKGINNQAITGLLFAGDVTLSYTEKKETDYITTFEVGEETNTIVNTIFNKTYKSGYPIKKIVSDLVVSLGFNPENNDLLKDLSETKFINSVSFSDKSQNILTELLQKEGFYWHITNGELKITKENESPENYITLISEKTGLIEIPKKTVDGVKFDALINTKIQPGIQFKLKSEVMKLDGIYLVNSAKYKGDTHGKEWYMQIEATS